MAPSKRKASVRRKTTDAQEVTVLDSSPSNRPSAKKRKVQSRKPKKEIPATPEVEEEPSELEDEPVSDSDLIDSVISYLAISKDAVTVSREHANEGAGTEKIQAFAKIAGKDWTYYVHEQVVNIGRPPDERQAPIGGVSSPVQELKDQFPVHIDLGPSKIVSRHHASIFYDGESVEPGGWFVRVNGRNGVRVDNHLLKRGSKAQLHSGAILEIASTQMMFVMPNERVNIDPYFLDRAKSLATGDVLPGESDRDTEPERLQLQNGSDDVPSLPLLAPAPLEGRSKTPSLQDGRAQRTVFDSKPTMSPIYGRGMMMESTQEIDYSRDSAKDLKPPYSYAHMIAQAIFSNEEEKLTLANIYSFIADKYAFYRFSNSGWQNSIRHNLSLNKAFQKVPRRTDEPGKGMKWQIAPEYRQEYLKKMQRKGGGSSNPSSPAATRDVNPNFRGPNGQNLGYDTTMVSSFSARDGGGPKMHMSFPPYPPIGGPGQMSAQAYSSQPVQDASTPVRSRANTNNTMPEPGNFEDSPLPHYPSGRPRQGPYFSIGPSSGAAQQSPGNPTLSSSYLDTPFHPSQINMITPAPLRQNIRLAPPSTLVAPSKFMPESSPAGPGLFWKGFLGGATPGPLSALPPDMSPIKASEFHSSRRNGIEDRDVLSSSPPPPDAEFGSPSKAGRGRSFTNSQSQVKLEEHRDVENEDVPTPKTRLAESNGNGRLSFTPGSIPTLLPPNVTASPVGRDENHEDEEDDDDGGIDLAKGFAPISSFSSQRGGAMTANR